MPPQQPQHVDALVDRCHDGVELCRQKFSRGIEQSGCHDHVTRTMLQPPRGIFRGNATADLQSARPSVQCLAGGIGVSGAQANHVAAQKLIVAIAPGIPRGIVLRHEIFARPIALIAQGAADNLLHLAVVQINAWSEFCHRLPRTNHYDGVNSSTK